VVFKPCLLRPPSLIILNYGGTNMCYILMNVFMGTCQCSSLTVLRTYRPKQLSLVARCTGIF
jgi:hypothetical protein